MEIKQEEVKKESVVEVEKEAEAVKVEVKNAAALPYLYLEQIGKGSFCEVYRAKDMKRDRFVAIKMETNNKHSRPFLEHEYKVLTELRAQMGIPEVYSLTTSIGKKQIAMQLLGPSVQTLFSLAHGRVSSCSLMMIGCQMLDILKRVHDAGYVHRDIKPANILVLENQLYLIDYGLSQKYLDETGRHVPLTQNNPILIGTPRYCSLHTHDRKTPSRRDDIESLAYVLLDLGAGRLPWSGLKGNTHKEKYDNIKASKIESTFVNVSKLLPPEVFEFFNYARGLAFDQTPDYQHWIQLFYARMCMLQPDAFAMPVKFRWCWADKLDYDANMDALKRKVHELELQVHTLKGRCPSSFSANAATFQHDRDKAKIAQLTKEATENAIVAKATFDHLTRYCPVAMRIDDSQAHIYQRLGLAIVRKPVVSTSSSGPAAEQAKRKLPQPEPQEEQVKPELQEEPLKRATITA